MGVTKQHHLQPLFSKNSSVVSSRVFEKHQSEKLMGLSSSETKWIIFVSYAFTLEGGGEKKSILYSWRDLLGGVESVL